MQKNIRHLLGVFYKIHTPEHLKKNEAKLFQLKRLHQILNQLTYTYTYSVSYNNINCCINKHAQNEISVQ